MKVIKIKEIWENSKSYATEDGKIFSGNANKGHLLKELSTFYSNSGYKMVHIKGKPMYVHRLVALAYIPNPENKKEINHKDLNKDNCFVSNLEWVTPSENVRHAKNNTKKKTKTSSKRGVLYKDNNKILTCNSLQEAKKYCKLHYNCSLSTLGDKNINVKNKLIYIRAEKLQEININSFWFDYLNTAKALKEKNIQEQKGLKGYLYKNDIYINSFNSIREANKYIQRNLKQTKTKNIYKVSDYTYIIQ